MHVWVLSYFQLFATPWTLAMEFSRQGYWIELLFPNPRDLPNVGIKPVSPAALALADRLFITVPPGKPRL